MPFTVTDATLSDLGVRGENPVLASHLADERHFIGLPVAWWQLYRHTGQPGFCCIIEVGLWSPQLLCADTTHVYKYANLYMSVEHVKQMLRLCLRILLSELFLIRVVMMMFANGAVISACPCSAVLALVPSKTGCGLVQLL